MEIHQKKLTLILENDSPYSSFFVSSVSKWSIYGSFLGGWFHFLFVLLIFHPETCEEIFFGWQKHAKTATNLVLLGPGSLCRPLLASGFNAAELEPFSPARFSGEATAALGPRCFVFFVFL